MTCWQCRTPGHPEAEDYLCPTCRMRLCMVCGCDGRLPFVDEQKSLCHDCAVGVINAHTQ